MQEKLTDKEKKFLLQMEKWNENIRLNYIALSILFCLAIFGLIIGIITKSKDGFLVTIYFGTLGVFGLITFNTYKKFIKIIKKLIK